MKKSTFNRALNRSNRIKNAGTNGVSRIEVFIQLLLDYPRVEISPSIRYAFALLFFDGVPFDQIDYALQQQPYRTPDGVSLSWREKNGRVERYILSSISIGFFSRSTFGTIQAINQKELLSIYQSFFCGLSLKHDQLEWFSFHLSGPVFEHLSGNVRMAALPDSAYVRLMTQSALENENKQKDQEALMQPLVHFFESKKADRNTVFVEQVIHACRRRVGMANYLGKQAMLQECMQISNLVHEYGPTSALILSWAISLITEGTRSLQDLSQAAISNYISSSAKVLLNEFKSEDIEDLDEVGFVERYKRVIEHVTDGQKNIVASAVSSFHAFLEDWLGVVPLNRNQFHKDQETIPKANVIWPHEIATVLAWLDEATCDERLTQFWRLALLIGSQQRIRVGELFELRLNDVHFFDQAVEVHIVRGKTTAAKRCLRFEHSETIQALKLMFERRQRELAHPTDFIFGDPKAPKDIYKRGQFYFGLNRLLKQVTGDRAVSFHTLSHAVISFKLIEALVGGGHGFQNPLSQLATEFGHFSIITSVSAYMHLYPISLRNSMDHALQTVNVNSRIAALWSGKTPEALRKQISLKKLNANEFYWDCILSDNLNAPCIEELNTEHSVVQPTPPDMLQKIPKLRLENLLYVLNDFSDGIPIPSVASRHSLDHDYIHLILHALGRVLFAYRLAEIPANASIVEVLNVTRNLKKSGFDFHRFNQSKYQKLLGYLNPLTVPLSNEMEDVISAWLSLPVYGDYQAINENVETLKLLELFNQAGVEITQVAIFVADDEHKKARIDSIKKLFLMTYSIPPAIFMVQQRRGRPKLYISITEARVEGKMAPYGSALSISGFRAMMLTLAILQTLGEVPHA